MPRGVIELEWSGEPWQQTSFSLEVFFESALRNKLLVVWRYREGERAVLLWPESEMGKVVDL